MARRYYRKLDLAQFGRKLTWRFYEDAAQRRFFVVALAGVFFAAFTRARFAGGVPSCGLTTRMCFTDGGKEGGFISSPRGQ
jgi:hypothetical protein